MACGRCGANDHSRASHQTCPFNKKRLAGQAEEPVRSKRSRRQLGTTTQPTTVKAKLNTFVASAQAWAVISDRVKRTKAVVFEGWLVANLVVLKCLTTGQALPLVRDDDSSMQSFFYNCMRAASASSTYVSYNTKSVIYITTDTAIKRLPMTSLYNLIKQVVWDNYISLGYMPSDATKLSSILNLVAVQIEANA